VRGGPRSSLEALPIRWRCASNCWLWIPRMPRAKMPHGGHSHVAHAHYKTINKFPDMGQRTESTKGFWFVPLTALCVFCHVPESLIRPKQLARPSWAQLAFFCPRPGFRSGWAPGPTACAPPPPRSGSPRRRAPVWAAASARRRCERASACGMAGTGNLQEIGGEKLG